MLALTRHGARLMKSSSVRALAGPISVHTCDETALIGAASVKRTEPKLEMGVFYPPHVPSPMEGTFSIEPIVVDGLVAKTGGGALGSPLQMIKLSPWDPTPKACKYTGLRFVSKQALEYAARTQK
eukprot:CAMPEP_0119309234 /NCGR_PEP_ID=MMETSP1333-20130426/14350_1 /TAXON_ID=418940 /ORGANISM="Scyphosphaera apsteinii, Strain RCC1455" /LENGTH=124 /DNA_ID=CAMNT_0007313171 /DNA_START=40 /DNA_END=414 /DNA_ORIENTATION=+